MDPVHVSVAGWYVRFTLCQTLPPEAWVQVTMTRCTLPSSGIPGSSASLASTLKLAVYGVSVPLMFTSTVSRIGGAKSAEVE